MVQQEGVDLSVLHWDTTTIHLEGEYDDSELVAYGRSSDNRFDNKLVKVGMDVTSRERGPLLYTSSVENGLRRTLDQHSIGTGIHYPIPCHLQPAFRSLGYNRGDLPVTEQVADEVLSLPMYPELTAEQRTFVVDAILEFYGRGG